MNATQEHHATIEHAALLVPADAGPCLSRHAGSPVLLLVFLATDQKTGRAIRFTQGFRTTRASRGRYRALLRALHEAGYVEPAALAQRIVGRRLSLTLETRLDVAGPHIAVRDYRAPGKEQLGIQALSQGACVQFAGHLLINQWTETDDVAVPAPSPAPPPLTGARPIPQTRTSQDQGKSDIVYVEPAELERRADETSHAPPDETPFTSELTAAVAKVIAFAAVQDWIDAATRADQHRLVDFGLLCLSDFSRLSIREIQRRTGVHTANIHRWIREARRALPGFARRYDEERVLCLLVEHAEGLAAERGVTCA